MQVVASLDPTTPLAAVPAFARRVEAMGYDALHVAETVHDGFAVSLLALEHTTTLLVRTSVVIAFPRSPMVTALGAWELAAFSGGRFELGLGTQIRQNIVDRFSVEWRDPVARMGEYLDALTAIWDAFQSGERLRCPLGESPASPSDPLSDSASSSDSSRRAGTMRRSRGWR